ncbi:MAG: hypothetical protein FJ144_10910 [Deltaproteobacteria bacterium]|nr:hypothetical protein [Deltaproteobacteria bacterium]
MDPHHPYDPPKSDKFQGALTSRAYPERTQRKMNRYDGEIRFLDRQIGALFAFLRERGLYDDAVIVIVADHGEQFREHEKQGHGYSLHNVEIHVALLLKAGGRRGEVERTVSITDIFPTILELAGAGPRANHGESLLDPSPQRLAVLSEQVGFSLERGNQKAIVDRRGRKLILGYGEDDWSAVAPETELGTVGMYRSRSDPFEEKPILDLGLEARLRARFYEAYGKVAERRKGRDVPKVTLEEATVERLRMLGYVGE